MEHERMRFETLTIPQLRTRLNRITDREKLRRFIRMAEEFATGMENMGRTHRAQEYRDLGIEAYQKLYGADPPPARLARETKREEKLI